MYSTITSNAPKKNNNKQDSTMAINKNKTKTKTRQA
jgi:hypothetical protein